MTIPFYLASQSPRRCELLTQAGFRFERLAVSVDETPATGEAGLDYVRRVVADKLRAALAQRPSPSPVLVADTEVLLDGRALGKPVDATDAATALAALSGRTHQVVSRVAVADGTRTASTESVTEIDFARLSAAQIRRYCDSGEPLGKAGSYAIQGAASGFVVAMRGSLTGVIGLPVVETAALLARFGVQPELL